MKKEASVSLVLDTQAKTEKRFLRVRITYGRTPRIYTANTDIKLTQKEFENDKLKITKEAKEAARRAINIATEIVSELGENFSFTAFHSRYKARLFGVKRDKALFSDFADEYMKGLKPKTQSVYHTAVNWVNKYHNNTKFVDIDSDFVVGLIAFIKKQSQKELGKEMSENSIRIYLRSLRAIYQQAVKDKKAVEPNPFNNIKGQSLHSVQRQKTALSDEELDKFLAYQPTNASEKLGKDFFVLTLLLSGANMGDILCLKNQNVKGNLIQYCRRKTSKSGLITTTPLTDVAVALLNEYGKLNPERPDDYILPFLAKKETESSIDSAIHDFLRKVNKGIKSICEHLGMDKITTYTARHTYAGKAKGASMTAEQIQLFLGHTSSRTTQIYLNSITTNVIEDNKSVLEKLAKK